MRTDKRTGILGGTFNPVHNGHIDIGLRVLNHFNLDSIRYILSAKPPHKDGDQIVSAALRWKMLEAGLEPYPELIPDDTEIRRDEYSWTIDTIKQLIKSSPDNKFYFLSGSEGFLKIRTWKEYRKLFKLINFIVVMRTGEQESEVTDLLKKDGITPVVHGEQEINIPAVYYYSYESNHLGLSSTHIRNLAGRREKIDGLVNKKVKEIIEENNLYGKNQPG
ncbi:MAG: nicotinate-nucleotide adenylyltransferase [Candidatus Aminicenantes bacterium]|nr:nicotinate-nucleotide adenylyltransferase [Candidatus Aminicenantes bacterium]